MTPEQELVLMLASCVGGGVVIRWMLEAYVSVFWLFWDIVESIV